MIGGSVRGDQSAGEQRMGIVDQRVPPRGDLDLAGIGQADRGGLSRRVIE